MARELQEEVGLTVAAGPELLRFDHAYTHRRLTFAAYLCRVLAGEARPVASQQVAWVWPRDLRHYPFPAAHARMVQALGEHLGGA